MTEARTPAPGWAILLAALWMASACVRAVVPDRTFTLRPGQSAALWGTQIRVRLDGVGHGWLGAGGGHFAIADLTISSAAGAESPTVLEEDEIGIGDYTLQVLRIVEGAPGSAPEEGDRCTLRFVRAGELR